jgi:PIN domain nuclease of toxin-antitoxin system
VTVVLDAWAVMALLQAEAAGPRVNDLIEEGDALMSVVNLGEAYYNLVRRVGERPATTTVAELRARVRVEAADWLITATAAKLKARGGLSYPDAFCIATAQRHRAPLWTGDDEILALADEADMVDLR